MAGELDYSDGCCGSLCGDDSCRGNMCPAAVDAAIFDRWDVQEHGEIPNNMWLLGFVPGDNCGYVPFRFFMEDMVNKFTDWCFGDVKINAITSSDAPCCNKCWALMDGRKINYYNKSGDLVECYTMCDMRGQVPVMADPTDYYGHGLTSVGMCTGEAKHTMQCEESRVCDITDQFDLSFKVPTKAIWVPRGDEQLDPNEDPILEVPDGYDYHFILDIDGGCVSDTAVEGTDYVQYTTAETPDGCFSVEQDLIKGAEADTQPTNNMQPSKAVSYYMYICKPGLCASIDEGSKPAKPACYDDYGVREEAENNDYPWWVPQP